MAMSSKQVVTIEVNGATHEELVPPRLLLSDFLRERLDLTGTHLGCEQGVCGACTVLLDGAAVRSCLMFAVQADGHSVTTIEGIGSGEQLTPLQEAFNEHHAMQCGFCTAGFIVSATAMLAEDPAPDDDRILDTLGGNLCRCTGYQNIVAAVWSVARGTGGES
jgi:aerobic carbon-monoxide dehydrogenase small subunit